eukprot:1374184-Pyramimonas_sp.AAC.1
MGFLGHELEGAVGGREAAAFLSRSARVSDTSTSATYGSKSGGASTSTKSTPSVSPTSPSSGPGA